MAQDTNSRASMTYDAYKQFVDPIDITPIQQQQQFEEQKQQFGVQEKLQKAKRRDELAKDLGKLTKHDLLPKVGEPVNQAIQQLKEGYVNGNITPDELRMGIVDVQQLISLGQNESDRAREILESDDPENWFYIDPETGLYERGLEAVKRVAYDGNGYGMSNEERIEALGTLNSSTGKLPEGDPRESIAARAKDLFMANATESQLEKVDSERMIGGETALFEISKVLGEDDRVKLINNLSKDLAIKDRLKYEYYDSKNNEEMESEYGTFENFVKETINDYLPTRESEQRMQYSADDEVVGDGLGGEESGFNAVASSLDVKTRNDVLRIATNITKEAAGESEGTGEFAGRFSGKVLNDKMVRPIVDDPLSRVIQINEEGKGVEKKPITVLGEEIVPDRIIMNEKGNNGVIVGYAQGKISKSQSDKSFGQSQSEKYDKIILLPINETAVNNINQKYGTDVVETYLERLRSEGLLDEGDGVTEITTEEEYNSLPSGATYIWNGQEYTKE